MKRLLHFFLLLISFNSFGQSGVITTIAGDGTNASTGDGLPAINAKVGSMTIGELGINQDFLFTEFLNSRVRRISRFGIVDSFIGNGTLGYSGDGQLAKRAGIWDPRQTSQDKHGNWYLADAHNHRIRRIDAATGIITTIAGTGTCGYSGNGGPAAAALLCNPAALCLDDTGNIFIFEQGNSVIRKIDTFGIITYIAGTLSLSGVSGDGGPATAARISAMACMHFDKHNNLYMSGFNIRKINMTTGIISKIAGVDTNGYSGDGGPATAAAVNYPLAFCFGNNGLLYLADSWNNRIRKIDSAGIITTVVGIGVAGYSGDGGLADTAKIQYPEGIGFDSCGNMYFCDSRNYRVRKVTYTGGTTPVPAVSIASNHPDTACAGTTITYSATATGGGTHFFYQWYVNGVLVSDTANAYTYIPINGDSVSCRVSTYSGCNAPVSVMSNVVHVVTGTPLITPTISIAGPATAAPGSTVTITAAIASAGSTYTIHWRNHGIPFATTTVPTVSYTKGAGTDTITSFIVPGGNCFDSTLSAMHVVQPDLTGVADVAASPMGIQLWPNPATDVLHVTATASIHSIVITDLLGRTVYSGVHDDTHLQLDVRALSKGVYVLKVNGVGVVRWVK